MNKQRKTSHILNVFQYDADGHVILPASLTLSIAPTGEDNSGKVPTTAWVRSVVGGTVTAYTPTSRTITINGTSYDLSSNRAWSIDTGVLTATAGSGISVSVVNQNLNIVNTGILTASSGAGISLSVVNQNLNVVNTGILTASAGLGISLSVVDQNLNVVNTGILTASAGSGISLSVVDQNLNVVNTGILTATAGAGISLSVVNGNLNVVNTITNNNQLTNGAGYITSSALTGYATETYVGTAISNLVDAAPGTLDTLNELAAALGDDPNFATTVATSIGTKQAQLNGTGFVKVTGTTVSYDNSTYLTTSSAASTYVALAGSYADPAWITSLAWSKVTGAPAFITSYTETDTLATVTARGASTSTNVTFNGLLNFAAVGNVSFTSNDANNYPRFTGNSASAQIGLFRASDGGMYIGGSANGFRVYDSSFNVRLLINQNGDTAFNSSTFTVGGSQVWTAANLTNLNQLSNGPGYITGYTETDTLATVTARGNTTSASVRFGSHADISPTNSAFRFYDGTTFRGGFGTDAWGHSGSDANLVLYVNGDNTLFFSTAGTKRASLSSSAFNSLVSLQQNGNQVLHLGSNTIPQNITLNTNADNWMWLWQASSSNSWYIGPTTANFGIGGNRLAISSSGSSPNSELVIERGTTRLLEVLQANLQYKGNVVLHAGNYTSYSPSLTGSGASGTWGIRITGFANQGSQRLYSTDSAYNYDAANPYFGYLTYDGTYWQFKVSPASPDRVRVYTADTLGGASANQTGGVNTIVQRDSNGYIQNSYFYTSGGGAERGTGISYIAGFNSSDYYIRSYTLQGLASAISGSSMNISGNATTANGANGNFYIDDNYGNTVVGVYASTRYQGVFAMGDSYKLPADGTTTGSLYGLAWSHPNAGGIAGNLNTHGLLVMENGTFLAAISGNIKARDGIIAGTYMYAPSYIETNGAVYGTIFYDNNDRAYYLDPNGYSNLGRIRTNSSVNDSGTGAIYGRNHAYDTVEIRGYGSELMIGSQGTDIHINYRTCNGGTANHTPVNWFWRAGASNNYSNHYFGEVYANGWFRTTGSQGLYNPTNDAHFYPNTASYGSWRIDGSKNGWHGLHFASGTTLMMNSNESGHHREGYGWQFRWSNGSMYVSTNSYGGGSEYQVIHGGNIGSQSVSYASSAGSASNATTLAGIGISTIRGGISSNNFDFYVNGDANTYYPVVLSLGGQYGMHRYSISRGYSDPAPWDPIGTGSHRGGLTLTFDCSSDIAWGGNDKSWRIIQFAEQYTNMVAGMALPVTDGIIVWLRGGGAYYRFHGPSGINHGATVYYSGYTGANGAFYGVRTNLNSVDGEIRAKWPIRGYGDGDMYVNNNAVIHAGNISSQSVSNSGSLGGYSSGTYLGKFGNGNGYYQADNWIQVNNSTGIFWPSYYSLHIRPNISSSYTQMEIIGSKGSYGGIYDSHSAVHGIMYDSGGNGGVYREANGRWYWYYHLGNACMGINTSTTSSSYAAYVNGNLYATGDITAYSDRRKKTDITTIDNALDKVTKLRGVYYNKIDDLEKGRQTGVIAQEINEVLPEVVTYAADVDEYGVKYGNIVGVLIEAIKEQQKQIEELQNKLDNVLSSR